MAPSLRGQVRTAIVLAATVSVVLLGVPLAIGISRLIDSRALTGLQRDAVRGVAAVPDNVLETGAVVRLPGVGAGTQLAVYDVHGDRVSGSGPQHSALAARAADGREHDGQDGRDLAVVVPVLSDTAVAGSARASVTRTSLHERVWETWALLALLAVLSLAVALLLARRSSRVISQPFEQLTAAARVLAEGRAIELRAPTGAVEADAVRQALEDSAREVEELVRHEREFVRDASHQLRTPLSALVLSLEQDRPDVDAALSQARYLTTTISDLVSLRALATTGSCDPVAVARQSVARWSGQGHRVELRAAESAVVGLSEPALRQALDVLIDNALRHGAEPVRVTVEPYGDSTLIEVSDEGAGFPDGLRKGTGLGLATRVVERAGGSLVVRRSGPAPRIALLVPRAQSSS